MTTDLSPGTFPEVIDNSMRSTFTMCEQKFTYSYIENLTPVGTSVHLHAGGAFAHGIETTRRAFYIHGHDQITAVGKGITELLLFYGDYECPEDSPKSAERMAGALEYYFDQYPMATDFVKPWTDGTRHGIEFNFTFPLPVPHPVTGQPILYTGRFDMLGQHENGSLFVVDEKTATALGHRWSAQWELDSQFTGYCYGAMLYNQPVVGALIRGISILKTKYDKAQAIIYRPKWQIVRWHAQLVRDVRRMIELWANPSSANLQLDKGSCAAYGGCAFQPLCSSPQPDKWIPVHFEPRVWHPLLREDREIELAQTSNIAGVPQ